MSEGIKESKEVIAALVEVLKGLGPILKDGFQAGQDLTAILTLVVANEQFKSKLQAAIDGADKIPAEVSDLSITETVELLIVVAPEIQNILNAWKK
jgi:hypothetical protein